MKQITLAAARVSAGLTQQELADKIGVSRTSIIKWETGQTPMKPAYFYAVCQVTGFDVNDIILPEASTNSSQE